MELTLEQLASKVDDVSKIATKLETFMAEHDKHEHDEKAKKAMEDKKHEEARKAKKTAALKKAMEEPDDEKRDAAIRKAMEEDKDDEHKESSHKGTVMDEHDHDNHKGMKDDEKKDHEAAIASVIEKERTDLMTKIMTANRLLDPTSLKAVEERVKSASIQELQTEWKTIEPFVGNTMLSPADTQTQQPAIPFFMAGVTGDAGQFDKNQLNANSPDSEFAKLSTKEIMEMHE
jgi:hypothetical protein